MKKYYTFVLVIAIILAMAASAMAVPPGKTLEFSGKGAGKVIFNGKLHADKGSKCANCHQTGLFKMKKGADIMTMKDMQIGKYCGECHNGTKAFSVKDQASCGKCHKK